RSRHLLFSDLTDASKVPYALTWFERNKTPDALTTYVMNYLVPNAAKLTLKEWFNVEVLGKRLYQYGLWELLYLVLSSEGFDFVQAAGGYDSNVANAKGVATLPAHPAPTVNSQPLVGVYALLPRPFVRQFEKGGARVCLNPRLESFGTASRGGAAARRG